MSDIFLLASLYISFASVDYDELEESGGLEDLRSELQDFWAEFYDLPREQVKITLSSGSLIVEVELDVQGQAEVIEEAAVLAQQEAENVATILEAIKVRFTHTHALTYDKYMRRD